MSPGCGSLPLPSLFHLDDTSLFVALIQSSQRVAFRLCSLLLPVLELCIPASQKESLHFLRGVHCFSLSCESAGAVASRIGWVGRFSFLFLHVFILLLRAFSQNGFFFSLLVGGLILRLSHVFACMELLLCGFFLRLIRLSSIYVYYTVLGQWSATYCALSDLFWCLGYLPEAVCASRSTIVIFSLHFALLLYSMAVTGN